MIEKRLVDKLNTKRGTLATKAVSKSHQDQIVKLQVFNSKILRDKIHFEDDGIENY